jgi:hypothetical protein
VWLAHIVPISLLDTIPDEQTTHLVLSELILTNKRYREFYLTKRHDGHRIILDNPVHEDRPVTPERWLEAVNIIAPQVAVMPDVIDSDVDTLASAEAALRLFSTYASGTCELMAVPHGQTQLDWLQCAVKLASFPEIKWFGISLERRLQDDKLALYRRTERVQLMRTHSGSFGRIKLHLLGTSEAGLELGEDPIWQRASSADSSKFAVFNMSGIPVSPPVPITTPYPGRAPFGGGYGYFFAGHPPRISRRGMRKNLRLWTEYAQRGNNY